MKILFVGEDAASTQYQRMFEKDGHDIVRPNKPGIDGIVEKFREVPPTYDAVIMMVRGGGLSWCVSEEFPDPTPEDVSRADITLLEELRKVHPKMPCIDIHISEIGPQEKKKLEEDPNMRTFDLDRKGGDNITYMTDFLRTRIRANTSAQGTRRETGFTPSTA